MYLTERINKYELYKVEQRLTKDGINVDMFRNIMSDFKKNKENELLLQDFHGDELNYFNLLCEEEVVK